MLARAIILSAATVVALGAAAGPAGADQRYVGHGPVRRGPPPAWHRHYYRPGGYRPWVYAAPPPFAYAAPPPVYYAPPPPVYYAPAPGLSLNFSIP